VWTVTASRLETLPDVLYYGVNEMGDGERSEILEWYEKQEPPFDNRHVLEQFMQIGNLDAFLESITFASACNKVLRKRFLQPDIIGLIRTGGYTCNKNYSKKAMMWLLHMEEKDSAKTMHGRNGRAYKVLELPHFSVDGYSLETRTIYEFFGCYFHGHTCQPIVA